MFKKPCSTRTRNSVVLMFLSLSLGGCATPTPTLSDDPNAEITFDGLHELKNSAADIAWAMPGVDLSGFTKIKVQDAGIEFRPGGESGRSSFSRSSTGPFEVTEKQKARFREIVEEIVQDELGKSVKFALTDEPGPDVLLVRIALLDVASFVPPAELGRADIYLRDIGEVTLVLELRDSITGAILVRAIDRDAIGDSDRMNRSSSAANAADVKRLIRRWMSGLRKRLDTFSGFENAAD